MNLAKLTTTRFKHADCTLQDRNAYEEVKAKDTVQKFGAQSNPAYSTLDRNTTDDAKYQEDPGYETPDILHNVPDVEDNPLYGATPNSIENGHDETRDFTRKEMDKDDDIQPEPGYDTPEFKRKEMSTPSLSTFESQDSDIKRVEVNGDLYALPNKGTIKVKVFRD